jgi:hypothetical protein
MDKVQKKLLETEKYCRIVPPFYGVNPSVGVVLKTFSSEREKRENETCESLKWLKGAKLEDLEDALVVWIGPRAYKQ